MCTPSKQQRGAMLIMLMFIIALLMSAYLLQNLNPASLKLTREQKTHAALSEAKAVLIGRAIMDQNRPGSLPCPDADNNGSADFLAGNHCKPYIGRFPWRTLGIHPLQDGHGEPLWYTLSTNYRDDDSAIVNSSIAGTLSVDTRNDIVAIIFSVGAPLAGQVGRPSKNHFDYLEGENADADTTFSNIQSSSQNDRLIIVSRSELMQQVEKRVLGDAANALQKYFANPAHAYFPYATLENNGMCDSHLLTSGFVPVPYPQDCPVSSLPDIGAWFKDNGWMSLMRYEVAPACVQTSSNCSGASFIVDGTLNDVRVRLIMSDTGQKRLIR
jgi:hypothetical protein